MKEYQSIIKHYESCFEKHGDSHLGMDWPNTEDVFTRFQIMLESVRENNEQVSILDFGCGTGHLLEHIKKQNIQNIKYTGLDVSKKFIDKCKEKFPDVDFICADVLDQNTIIENHDYIIMNGVFTEKREMTFDAMWKYFQKMITTVYKFTNKGISSNVMSKNVDWERDDLFHVPLDLLTGFLCKEISRNFVIRNDYGLYEYTTYIYK